MSESIEEKIIELFQDDKELRDKLLELNADAIRSLAEYNYNIPPKNSKNFDRKSIREPNEEIKNLYFKLLDEYYKKETEIKKKISTK